MYRKVSILSSTSFIIIIKLICFLFLFHTVLITFEKVVISITIFFPGHVSHKVAVTKLLAFQANIRSLRSFNLKIPIHAIN